MIIPAINLYHFICNLNLDHRNIRLKTIFLNEYVKYIKYIRVMYNILIKI